jgi:cellulase
MLPSQQEITSPPCVLSFLSHNVHFLNNLTISLQHYENPIPEVFPDAWHHGDGPLLSYLAACPGSSCSGWEPSGAVWFKIDQKGLRPDAPDLRGPWWQSWLIAQGNPPNPGYSATIPKNLRPGNYLLRTEVIMMAGQPAQIYPECAQLTVTGEGTAFPSEEYLVSFPGAYAATGRSAPLD